MTHPAPTPATRSQLLRDPLLVGGMGLAGFVALHFRDPHESTWILCPFLTLTGYPCPGCGGLRALNLLSNGDFLGAVSSNLVAVLLVPIIVFAWLMWLWRRARGDAEARMIYLSNTVIVVATIAIVAFGIFRVTPFGAWFAP